MKTDNSGNAQQRDYTSLLTFLSLNPKVHPQSTASIIVLTSGKVEKKITVRDLSWLAAEGLVVRHDNQILLTTAGHKLLAASCARAGISLRAQDIGNVTHLVIKNDNESPLFALLRRKSVDGSTFLSQQEFEAGERIREDFTRGMLMPRTTANWQASVSGGRRAGDENGIENLTNGALAARIRFDGAMKGLGNDLSGVIADICCFLKGFEQVEAERGWPKRSAKFLLKAGLAVLANHYWPRQTSEPMKLRRWGTADYRPTIR